MIVSIIASLSALFGVSLAHSIPDSGRLDLTNAVVIVPQPGKLEHKAAQMLVDEVAKRTRVRWKIVSSRPKTFKPTDPVIGLITCEPGYALKRHSPDLNYYYGPEGYLLGVSEASVDIFGSDPRGTLYAVGRLLRNLRMERDRVTIPLGLKFASKPYHKLRGHQLGYRPKTNSYDGWDVPMWEQYIRDLIVFGANAVELIPPRSDDAADSPHFPLPPMQMMVEMSRLLDSYGMDVWVWYPALDKDYTDPKTVAFALKEWGDVFRKLPRIDAVYVPGGDPGHTEPKVLMALLEKQAANLHRYHPKAQMWVSPQGFSQAWMDQFIGILRNQRPKWLNGVVFGPQVRTPLPLLRKLVPPQYPIRHYPDITHSVQCQFPVENWDVAYALTEGREVINPRPVAESVICRWYQPYTIGSITYSEGCNDDVNKAVWSALEWDPRADVKQILREYSRYFIGPRYEESFADGLLALESNWQGGVMWNDRQDATFTSFQKLERGASPQTNSNWRFLQALYRAYYDRYVVWRWEGRRSMEEEALERLALASDPKFGVTLALNQAVEWLSHFVKHQNSVTEELEPRINRLAEALFQTIRMQLSVPLYQAISVDRGANLDTLNHTLNNRDWLLRQIGEIRRMKVDADRLKRINQLVHWADPGPGGYYDLLSDPQHRPHLIRGKTFEQDPGHMESVRIGFDDELNGRVEWTGFAETLYDTPLRMRYTGLDSNAQYRIRVVYGPDKPEIKLRLMANDSIEVHPWLLKPQPTRPVEFDIPRAATVKGELNLAWTREPGIGGNGRGCQVCEVWILKTSTQRQ